MNKVHVFVYTYDGVTEQLIVYEDLEDAEEEMRRAMLECAHEDDIDIKEKISAGLTYEAADIFGDNGSKHEFSVRTVYFQPAGVEKKLEEVSRD